GHWRWRKLSRGHRLGRGHLRNLIRRWPIDFAEFAIENDSHQAQKRERYEQTNFGFTGHCSSPVSSWDPGLANSVAGRGTDIFSARVIVLLVSKTEPVIPRSLAGKGTDTFSA